MVRKHGNKIYKQLLLDPAKFEILDEIAKQRGIKATALIREVVYEWIEKQVDSSRFKVADALDEATWRQSVRNRVEGRSKPKNKTTKNAMKVQTETINKKTSKTNQKNDKNNILSTFKNLLKKN